MRCTSAGEPGLCGRGGHGADGTARHRAAAHRDSALCQLAVPGRQAHRLPQLAQPCMDGHSELLSCQITTASTSCILQLVCSSRRTGICSAARSGVLRSKMNIPLSGPRWSCSKLMVQRWQSKLFMRSYLHKHAQPIPSLGTSGCYLPCARPGPHAAVLQAWRLLAQDPDRCGILPFVFDDDFGFARYAEFALDVPMYFVSRWAASCTQDARVPAVASAVKAPTATRRISSSAACPPGLLHMTSNDTHQPSSLHCTTEASVTVTWMLLRRLRGCISICIWSGG